MNLFTKNVAFVKGNKQKSEGFINIVTYILVVILILGGFSLYWDIFEDHQNARDVNEKVSLDLSRIEEVILEDDAELSRARNHNCSFWDCFNIYRCGQREQDQITIYVYPLKEYFESSSNREAFVLTEEFYEILKTIVSSSYYTPNPNEACMFVPSIDMLNQNLIDVNLAGKALASLDYWENGENHLLFNMLPGSSAVFNRVIDVNTDKAIILGGGFDSWTYRVGFDVSFPVWSPELRNFEQTKLVFDFQRKYFLVVAQLNIFPEHKRVIQELTQDNSDLLLLETCASKSHSYVVKNNDSTENKLKVRCVHKKSKHYEYPKILSKGTFCLIVRSLRLGQPDFIEALAFNCIPVIVADNYVLPFEDVIDWNLALIRIKESDLHSVIDTLKEISATKIMELQRHGKWLFQKYFKNLHTITMTALDILNDRVFPHFAKNVRQWNTVNNYRAAQNPLFLPLIASKSQGFTAVILTYDRVESLFTLLQKLAIVPSLQNILVIWNNQKKPPPHMSLFPKIIKPLKVVQTKANKLSNRFFPYDEIETEAILTIDDDIVMLTADELDFGYEVWREFPDRIVGFPSRIHVWDNITMQWRYESEWTNQISMVLTGAAFHHKYWSYMYTNAMPGDIKDWVDEHMNCEDIAMNFLVANITNKPPIKVAPRKKFKCPECTNNEMLSADLNHMMERSACIDRFAKIYGRMPLKSVEFRADPVLFRDNFPEKLKRFNDIGNL